MAKKNILTKTLAIAGTAIAWLPILAPVVISIVFLFSEGVFRFDYLMPAELFPIALAGGGLLLWAGLRARARYKLFGWSLGAAVVLLVGSQFIAEVSGIASGAHEPAGWLFDIIIAGLIGYILALVANAINGVLLLRDLFQRQQ